MRYILDERVGCAAVIDTRHPDYDPEYPGLHSDTGGVVLYEGFTNQSKMNISESEVEDSKRVIERLKKACDALNDKKPRTKTEYELLCNSSFNVWGLKDLLESGSLFYFINDEYRPVSVGSDIFAIEHFLSGHIYRKVKTEIDERQEFIDAAFVIARECDTEEDVEWMGKLYDSGRFKLVG